MTRASDARAAGSLRVVHLITGLGTGGAEMTLLKLCTALDLPRFSSHVITLGAADELAQRFADGGVRVESLQMDSPVRAAAAPARLAYAIRKLRPHVIQGWMPHGNLASIAASVADVQRAAVLWNVRQSLDLEYARDARRTTATAIRVGARLSWWPRAIVYNSHIGQQQHEAIGYDARRSVLIPNGFELDRFRPNEDARASVRAELRLPADALLVGLVARYHPMKDHRTFLDAVASVLEQMPDVHFVLVGRGVDPANQELNRRLRALGLKHAVFLLGERSDIPRIAAALDVGVCASRTLEGFSNSIGEAMSCGVPCVVTDVGDARNLVADTGRVIAPSDPFSLATELLGLLRLETGARRRLGDAARARIRQHFSMDSITRHYADLYEDVANAKSRPRNR